MSLHSLAHHLQQAGRGEDKVLVHMTPAEVGGLQNLALKHGGSLTTNPETGLPEAGFLSSILPMIAGFALGPAGLGLSAMQAGLATGALGTALTGSLGKGLMAGLGAYGGAGLGAGISSAGATELANAAPEAQAWNAFGKNSGVMNQLAANEATNAANFAAGFPGAPTAETVAQNAVQAGGLPGYTPYSNAVSNTVPVGAPVPAQGAMNLYNQQFTSDPIANVIQQSSAPKPALMDAIREAQSNIPAQGSFNIAPAQPGYADVNFNYVPQPALQGTVSGLPEAPSAMDKLSAGLKKATGSWEGLKNVYEATQTAAPYSGIATLGSTALGSYYDKLEEQQKAAADAAARSQGMIRPYQFTYGATDVASQPYSGSAERVYFNPRYTALTPYKAPGPEYAASGGLMKLAVGGPVEEMSAANSVGENMMYPQANINTAIYSNPMVQRPMPNNVIKSGVDVNVDPYTGEQKMAGGGLSNLGSYSDGGRLLKGPGDGVSDSIPASIGGRQPARLADGEFVIPARIVSEIGNGSTDAGAKRLYAMMDRIQNARRKTVGKDKVATNTNAEKYLPA